MLNHLSQDTFQTFIASSETVLVDFWATWCGPCQRQGAILEELAQEEAIAARIGKIDVDECRDLAIQYGVSAIPTLIYFKAGKEEKRIVGLQDASDILKNLN